MSGAPENIQRPPAELVYAAELERLRQWDPGPVPPGWLLSPRAIRKFVLGDGELKIRRKFVGEPSLVDRVTIALATNRGAMLVGEPGTAKSWLSELLAAAISGTSTLVVQGGASTSHQGIMYSWNGPMVAAHGPTRQALVAGAVMRGLEEGKIVRFEEMARCPSSVQDTVLSVLSDRVLVIPELGDEGLVFARDGFNIIGTANTRDRGIHEMSAALKRRMNYESIRPIRFLQDELEIVESEATRLLEQAGVPTLPPREILEVLVTIFRELRGGRTEDGRSTDRLTTVMSTAEAVSVAHALGVHAYYARDGRIEPEDLVHFLVGAALKDQPEDRRRMRHYFDTEVRRKAGTYWNRVYELRDLIQ